MAERNTVERVKVFLMPILEATGFELFDLEYVKEGANWILRVYIDKEGGVTIDDCELVSRQFEKILDEKDPIPQNYVLEVSSPGIDRPLRNESDYDKYRGEIIDIKLYKPISGRKEYQGVLEGQKNGVVTITDNEGGSISFSLTDIASCRLAVIF